MRRDEIFRELDKLIQLDYEASRIYEQTIGRIGDEDADVRTDLVWIRDDHLKHVADLSRVVVELGGTPLQPARDLKGALLEAMTRLRSLTGTVGVLQSLRLNEKLTNRSYEKAAERELPRAARDVVIAHRDDERRHLATLEEHIVRLGEEAEELGRPNGEFEADARL